MKVEFNQEFGLSKIEIGFYNLKTGYIKEMYNFSNFEINRSKLFYLLTNKNGFLI